MSSIILGQTNAPASRSDYCSGVQTSAKSLMRLWNLKLESCKILANLDLSAPDAVAPSVSTGAKERNVDLNTNIYKATDTSCLGDCKSRAVAAGGRDGRAGSVARRPHGRGRPHRGENTMKSEEQSRGQATGFFTGRGVLSIRLSMCKERIWCAVWRSNIFLHQLAGRVGPI